MQIDHELSRLNDHRDVRAKGIAFQGLTIAHHDSEGKGGLAGKTKLGDKLGLNEVMGAPAVDEEHHLPVSESTYKT